MPTIITREAIVERRHPGLRWSVVFAGTAVSVGVWLLLQVLGLGVGLTAIDVDNAGSLRGAGIGTSVWSFIAPLVALFIGGAFAARIAMTRDRLAGATHGFVIWSLTSVIGLIATASLVMMLASGAAQIGTTAVRATGDVAGGAAKMGMSMDPQDVLAPINQRLQDQGKPALTPDQLTATVRGLVAHGASQGHLDKPMVVEEIVNGTNLSRPEAEDVANQVIARWNQLERSVDRLANTATRAGLQAADAIGKVLLCTGLSLLLGLAAAIAGGVLGAVRGERRDQDLNVPPSTTTLP